MMINEIQLKYQELKERLRKISLYLNAEEKNKKIKEYDEIIQSVNFWNDKLKAQQTLNEINKLKDSLNDYNDIVKKLMELKAYIELCDEDNSEELLIEAEKYCIDLLEEMDQLETLSFLSDPLDNNNAYVSIHAVAGGTEACDWSSILVRMYSMYAKTKNWKYEICDIQLGNEAGIKNITIYVSGNYAYGYMKYEKGIHRLIRMSPFNANGKRQTSFSAVEVFPEITDDININIDENDLRIDTYRSSGKGGQGVNTTDSAVRITHIPTNIVVACQKERSQHMNKEVALKMLKAKLYEYEKEKKQTEEDLIRGEKNNETWGVQIRSYFLQPKQLIKDHRTNFESTNANDVFNGNIQGFIDAALKMNK